MSDEPRECDNCGDDLSDADMGGLCEYCADLESCDGCGCDFSSGDLTDGLCDMCEDDSDDEDEDEDEDEDHFDAEEFAAGAASQCAECNGPFEGAGDVCEECLDGAGVKE